MASRKSQSKVLESSVEDDVCDMVKARGGLALKLVLLGLMGWADRTILLPGGRILFAELKRPVGGKVRPMQKVWRKRLLALGFQWIIATSVKEVEDAIDNA